MADAAIAFANNDMVLLVWRYGQKLDGCLGFSVQRRAGTANAPGRWIPLPAWVGFEGQDNPAWKASDTDIWPIQKFSWKDLTARRGRTYSYRIVPMMGAVGALTPDLGRAVETPHPVVLSPKRGVFRTFFNRGILSTQFVTHALPKAADGSPDTVSLLTHGTTPGDPLREALAGDILTGLLTLLRRVKVYGGRCYAALYELADKELLAALVESPALSIILSNTGADDAENHDARTALHAQADTQVTDRFITNGIGHNKFVVYEDARGVAQAVLLGSTNWTWTALVGQSNNALIVESPELAARYLDYWRRLKADTRADGHGQQGEPLRTSDNQPGDWFAIDPKGAPDARARVWFSPNTARKRASPVPAQEPAPGDLAEVFALMDAAQHAILFLEFQPGSPSVIDHAAAISLARPDLFVRGAVTDPAAAQNFRTVLFHRPGADPEAVAPASAIKDQFAFWQAELLKSSAGAHAIIHDKIVVIDPISPDCVVVTGSHNQGYTASHNNDENLLIVKGHGPLAQAYAAHVMDIYDHYRFRFILQEKGHQAFSGLHRDDGWQDPYFTGTRLADESRPWGL